MHSRYVEFRRGAASIALVLVLILVGLVVVILVLAGAREHELTVSRVDSVQAFFAAEAGMNMAVREMIDDEDYDGDGVVARITSTSNTQAALHGASVAVTPSTSGSNVMLNSLGERVAARHAFRLVMEPLSGTGSQGNLYGVAVTSTISLTGGSRMDAFDSTSGTYAPYTNYSGSVNVATNTTDNGGVTLTGSSTIVGDLYVGVGGNPVTTVSTSGTAQITGTRDALTEPVDMPTIAPPGGLPSSVGNSSFPNWGTTTISEGTYHYNNFIVSNDFEIWISGKVVLYCDGTFTIKNSGRIFLESGATLDVYADKFTLTGAGMLNIAAPPASVNPSLVHLYQFGSSDFTINNGGGCAAIVVAPNAEVVIPNAGHLFGVVRAASLSIENGGRFTQDLAYAGGFGSDSDDSGTGITIQDWDSIPPD